MPVNLYYTQHIRGFQQERQIYGNGESVRDCSRAEPGKITRKEKIQAADRATAWISVSSKWSQWSESNRRPIHYE